MTDCWQQKLDNAIQRQFDQVVAVRRHLHANPEPSGEENETSLYLYQMLSDLGFEMRIGPEGKGVIADLPGEQQSPLLALRADIDALRIQDQKQVEYRSQVPGVMHACGHDAHSSILLGALGAIKDMWERGDLPWPIRVRGIFQPAEETCQGAAEMIEAGAIDGVSSILALHVDPTREVGRIGMRDGVLTASCEDMRVKIIGRGGHAARPHEANDPIVAAAHLISSLYMFVPRRTDSQDAVVLTIGKIRGADIPNAIPEWIELRGTLRTLNHEVREKTIKHICQLAEGIGQTSDTKIEVSFGVGSGSVDNDVRLVSLFRQSATEVLGEECIEEIPRASMGSEDFAYYLEHVPGAMFRLGCTSPRVGNSLLHSPTFDVDEEALRIGVRIMARSAIKWFAPDSQATFDITDNSTVVSN